MAHVKEMEMEPPMHLQRPSSGRSQDVSHLLASVFREVFTRDVIGEDTIKNLAISKSGDAGYHDKYVEQLRKIQEERDRRHREADMLEAHIMQAQAAAMAADERELQRISEGYENYHSLGLPPAKSNLRNCLDTQLLRRYNLIVPEDFSLEEVPASKAPQADEVPGYARPTTSSQQRYRKTPPLTDYLDDTALSTSTWPWASLPPTQAKGKRQLDMSPPPSAKSRLTKSSTWKESMRPEQRQMEREALNRLQSKAEYKRNPRFVPPIKSGLTKSNKERKKTTMDTEKEKKSTDPVEIFIASPSPIVFTAYEVGKVYELLLELKNVTSSSRQLRIIPPSSKYFSVGLGRFPGEHGVVAPGLSCQYPIKFAPDSLADYDDFLKVKIQVDPPMVIPIQARRPPPVLSLSSVLDCGHTLVGGKKVVCLKCQNRGGNGKFCIMRKSSWPSATFQWTLENPGSILAEPFELKPAMFKLDAGEVITLEITFCPTSAKYFKEEVVFVCDNCHVKEFSIEGTGQMAGVELDSVSGGLCETEIGEMRDVSAQHLIRFHDENPETTSDKTLVIKNTTNVALPFRWKLYKPFFRCPVSPGVPVRPLMASSQVQRTLEDLGAFRVTPNMGTLPPHQSVDFILEFAPKEVGSYHTVGHLILEEIPIHEGDGVSTGSVRDATAVEIEMKAVSKPFDVCVSPPLVVCPGTLKIGVQYRFPLKMSNNSVSEARVSWRNVEEPSRRISVEPQSSVIGAGEEAELELIITVDKPGQVEEAIRCDLKHSSAPVYVYVKATFEGPEVVFTCPDLNFNLVRFREQHGYDHINIKNISSISAEWSIQECPDCLEQLDGEVADSGFQFTPNRGVLGPQESKQVEVLFKVFDGPQRVRTALQCDVKNGKTSYLPVYCEVQRPLVCLLSCNMYIEKVYLGVPVNREVVLHNQSLLTARFKWKQILEGDYTLTFEPSQGYLEPRKEMSIKLTFTGYKKGHFSNLITCCEVERMLDPRWLSIGADVQGLSVTFATPKIFDLESPEDVKEASLDDRELVLDFETVPLASCPHTTLVLTNTSAIRARFDLELDHFRAAKPPTPPNGAPQGKRGRMLGRTPNIADPVSKTATKAHADYCQAILRDRRGAAFVPSPASGELLPFGYQVIEITGHSDMWGEYRDLLICKIEGMDPVYIPVKMDVVGCPLNFQMMKDQSPILRFGTHVSGAPSVQRSLRINNRSPYDIRLDWEAYNIVPQDTQLLDMLVFIGEPLPEFKDGQEVVPAVLEKDCYQCEEQPFIQVKLREHNGACADRPFDVIPRQQVIPAKGHSSAKVSFYPHTDKPSGEQCTGYAAAYMSLDPQILEIPGRVKRLHGVELSPFRLDMTANIDPALLSVETEEDKGTEFITAASDLLGGETPLVHRFVLTNTTETPLTARFETKAPFKILATEPPPSAKTSRSHAPGSITVKPTKTLELKVGFCLSDELVHKVTELLPEQEQDDGTLLTAPSDGDRKLIFKRDLKVEFSNNTAQLIPLMASIAVPTLRLSQDVLDFGTCLVGQSVEMHVTLSNPSQSASAWITNKDSRYPPVSQQVFFVSPTEGFLEANTSLVARMKTTLKVTFTAKHNVEYECVIIVSGQLQEEEQRLVLRGRGSYDQINERLANVTTET